MSQNSRIDAGKRKKIEARAAEATGGRERRVKRSARDG
ncbi:hypothetical protein BTH_I1423 [Burkholderia thailandensis E264]|uniref:Uncharacterized protein n=1 Tax=Burkholderia thailandensis (strain ATCC 700388 / DSM 13276 / CCUG 48851 / CIP 106301 / E264) TaxID=271848 RepID=Q2SYN0_BURTA|nr:hypothetical protein BTH_I1423 [Burkholderia thailandensis E264]